MISYVFDGSFEGLLTCIYESYYTKEKIIDIKSKDLFYESFLYKNVTVSTDNNKSLKVSNAIIKKLGEERLYNIYYAFLSDDKSSYFAIYEYIKFAFKTGINTDMHINDARVRKILLYRKRVLHEAERFTGFVRFSCLSNGILYSTIEPDYNILIFLGEHFKGRMPSESFIIHDVKRNSACMYNGTLINYIDLPKEAKYNLLKLQKDNFFENLWKEYYKSTSIQNRKNEKLMKSHMPLKYFKNLTEYK